MSDAESEINHGSDDEERFDDDAESYGEIEGGDEIDIGDDLDGEKAEEEEREEMPSLSLKNLTIIIGDDIHNRLEYTEVRIRDGVTSIDHDTFRCCPK